MFFRLLLHLPVFALATIITQIGGLAYLGAVILRRHIPAIGVPKFIHGALLFLILYTSLWTATLFAAPKFGRVALPCLASDATKIVAPPLYCALNRHYVTPELLKVANDLAAFMNSKYPGTQTRALDANFPFFDGVPQLPHLSHDDGRKMDIAFFYKDSDGQPVTGGIKSPIGYWAFEEPRAGAIQPCAGRSDTLTLRWDMAWFRVFLRDYKLDEPRTAAALRWLATRGVERGVSKVFIEPHLAQRLGVRSNAIRFQGCWAARHDDHIHLQIR